MLIVHPSVQLPESELVERFLRADGPGGQHVQRTESAVELRFDVSGSPSLPEPLRARLLAGRDRRLNSDGIMVIQARRFREQARNRDDARRRLAAWILAVINPPRPRIATHPSRNAMQRRVRAKQYRASRKLLRRPPGSDE